MKTNLPLGQTGTRQEPLSNARFCIEIANQVYAGFDEASGLDVEVEVFEYQEGGNNLYTHKLPGRVKFTDVTLKRGLILNNDMWEWFNDIANRKIAKKNMSVILYDPEGKEVRRWNLENAYPRKWSGPSFRVTDKAIGIETVVFAHDGFSIS